MANQTLVERAAENTTKDENSPNESEALASELRVVDGILEFKTLDGEWNEMSSLRELQSKSTESMIESQNVMIPDSLVEEICELKSAVSKCWSEEHEAFIIDYRTDEDGDLKSLVVPLNCSVMDDVVVAKIHNDNGDFVAENIEEQIDFQMYKLWNLDMYVEDLSEVEEVLVESDDQIGFMEAFNEKIRAESEELEQINYDSASDWVKATAVYVTTLGVILSFFNYILQSQGVIWLAGAIIATVATIIPAMLCLLVFLQSFVNVMMGITSLSTAIKEYGKSKLETLFTVE